MKLRFKNADFTVVIGANPFDDIKGVANSIIAFITHKDFTKFEKELGKVKALVETNDVIDIENHITYPEDNINSEENDETVTYTIKTTGDGKLDTEDNDKLHGEWLAAFGDHLDDNSIDNWMVKANISESALDEIKRTI